MTKTYNVWFRDPLTAMEAQLGNPKFVGHLDYAAKQLKNPQGKMQYIDLMSGKWAWRELVRLRDIILRIKLIF